MKTILEFAEERLTMNKQAIDLHQVPAYTLLPAIAGGVTGKLLSDYTAPPAREYETFEAELLKDKLKNILKERAKRQKLEKYEEVVNGSKRSIRF